MPDANSPHYRPVHLDEYEDALTLWETVFGAGSRDYFVRYFTADPWYQPGDCLGAWLDDRLVSCVHICPRLLEWRGSLLRCGGIANVATLPEYRGRGLSRALLAQTLEVMWETGCGFSLLFTGRHRHYSALGWERVEASRPLLTLHETPGPPLLDIQPAIPDSEIIRLYEHSPRPPLLLQRTAPPSVDGLGKQYFAEWVGWRWQSSRAEMLVLPGRGYLVLKRPREPEAAEIPPLEILEWRALDANTELALLRAAAAHAWDRGQTRVRFPHVPHLVGMEALADLGSASFSAPEGHGMTRNIALPDAEYEEIKQLYASGSAPWFAADGF
jgi:GNAT superfamily N-acetyltransferase